MERSSDSKRKATISAPSGKLAFSLKPKSKLIAPPVKFGGDDEEDEIEVGNLVDRSVKRQKATQSNVLQQSSKSADVAPSAPSDPTVKKVADKLASFVVKNGRQFEHVTRQKNPGDTPFKFLFDESCADYKYYEYRLNEEERVLSRTSNNGSTIKVEQTPNGYLQKANYQIPASALYESTDSVAPGGANASSSADPVAMMEFYMKKAAQEEKRKLPKHSKDEMPPPASLQGSDKKGHHMGDYIPPEELEKFMSACNDVAAQKAAKEAAERAKIQADNVGHKLLSKMGWREGEGLGSSKNGIANPIMAGNVKKDTLGVGASQPGEVTPDDDIYEQYKKRMMLGYRHRPNPLGNPRKAYY